MANNRLTWQNVTAPDYGTSMRGAEAANKMFQDALGGLSTSLGSFITERKAAEDEALLKQQEAAERGVRAQLASVLGDVEAQRRIIQQTGDNPYLRADFLKSITGTDFNTLLTGAKTREEYDQAIFDNDVTRQEQLAREGAQALHARYLQLQAMGKEREAQLLLAENEPIFARLALEDQVNMADAGSKQGGDWQSRRSSETTRKQTEQSIAHAAQNQGWRADEQRNKQMADAAVVYALGLSPDPAIQRRGIIEFTAQNGGSPTAALAAFDRHIQAAQNASGGAAGGNGNSGGAGQSSGTSVPMNTDSGTDLGNNIYTEAERLTGELRTRAAQNQSLISDGMIDAGERNSSLASLYEEAAKNFPNTIGTLSPTEYNKLHTEIKKDQPTLTNDQIALAIEERFQMGPSYWESSPILTNLPFTIVPSLIGGAIFPDWGREAGVNKEGLERIADVVGTQEGRNLAVTQRLASANAEKVLQESVQRVTEAEQRKQQAEIHYQQWGNPAVLSDAERDLELEQENLRNLIFDYRTNRNESEILLPLYRDPENPGKTISVPEGRERNEAAQRANEITARNRNEALAAIAIIETQIERLQDEHRNIPFDSPRAAELAFELDTLRRSLAEAKKLAR